MILGFDFHPEARAEFFADVDWYDEREVGERFEVAVRVAIDAAVDSPESWAAWLLARTCGVDLSWHSRGQDCVSGDAGAGCAGQCHCSGHRSTLGCLEERQRLER